MFLEPQTESLQTETPPTVSHELQTEAHIEQILPSPSTYQRKQRKTQKHRRAKKVNELPQTSVPLDHGADEAVHKEGVTMLRLGLILHLSKVTVTPLSEVNASGRGEDNVEYHDDLTDFVPPTPHDSPLSGEVIVEDKGSGEKGGSTADQVSTARPEVSAASVPVNVSAATPSTPPTTTTIFGDEDLTIAQTLVKMRSKGVLVEEEPEKPVKVKRRDQGLAQIESDAELAQRLHEEELAELDRAQKERQKQEEATKKYTIEERARLLAEFFERRKKQLAAERSKAIRNKPPTRTQNLYEREKKWVDDFKPIDDNSQQQAESTKKKPRADSEEESSKKQKLEEDNDAEKKELRDSIEVVPKDDVAIDVESLATKYLIVDWKTHILNENMMYYQIIRADESSKNYKIFSEMLDDFDIQDVIDLHRFLEHKNGFSCSLVDIRLAFWYLLLGIIDFYKLVLLVQLDTAGDG
ncbi:hypothetical protein Tco_0454594 [Tanacetum coccineum]